MDLHDYVRAIRRGWPIVLALTVLGTAVGVGLILATTKVYQATVQVFVATSGAGTSTDLNNGNTFTQDRVQSYTSIANAPAVTSAVVRDLDLRLTRQQLADKITADAPLNKVLINIHVNDTNAREAAILANAVAARFAVVVQSTEQTDADGKPVVKLTVIHPATTPSAPIKPSKVLYTGVGLLIGLLAGIALVLARETFDNTVSSPDDFAKLDLPLLGLVPLDKRATNSPIAFRDDPHSTRSEAYRQLRTNLQFVNVDNAPRIIAVTSAVPGEGKTTTALNLAAALAEGGFRVCLIEADLRRPTLAKVLGLVGEVGFTTALIGKADAVDALQTVGRNLAIMTCGPVPPNPSELLITEQARQIVHEIAELADYTIIDTAPLLPVADGAEVSAIADATLVVHHAGKSTLDQVQRSLESLGKVGTRPVGAVLNMVSRRRGAEDYAYAYSYTYRPDRSRRAREENHSADAEDATT